MDAIDKKILSLLVQNARMPVKAIASNVMLTAPAVSERIKKMERDGTIGGYTVRMSHPQGKEAISAYVDITTFPEQREAFVDRILDEPSVESCYMVTGNRTYTLLIRCADMHGFEKLIGEFQSYGQTSTQIIVSTLIERKV